jgi:GTP cyclohydrolase II
MFTRALIFAAVVPILRDYGIRDVRRLAGRERKRERKRDPSATTKSVEASG